MCDISADKLELKQMWRKEWEGEMDQNSKLIFCKLSHTEQSAKIQISGNFLYSCAELYLRPVWFTWTFQQILAHRIPKSMEQLA